MEDIETDLDAYSLITQQQRDDALTLLNSERFCIIYNSIKEDIKTNGNFDEEAVGYGKERYKTSYEDYVLFTETIDQALAKSEAIDSENPFFMYIKQYRDIQFYWMNGQGTACICSLKES